MIIHSIVLILGVAIGGCSSRPSAAAPASTASPTAVTADQGAPRPLAPFTTQPLIIFPLQQLRVDAPALREKVGDPRAYLASADDEIAFAIRERRIRAKWAFPADLARTARRNPGFTADPYAINVAQLAPAERDANVLIANPLASELRALAGLHDARYALVPVELRVVPADSGARAVVHLVIVDVRQSKLIWKGDVNGDPVTGFSPALAAGVAGRVADLFAAAP